MRASCDGSDVPVHLERNADMWLETSLIIIAVWFGPLQKKSKIAGKWYIESKWAKFRMPQKVSCYDDYRQHISSGVGSVGHDDEHTNCSHHVYLYIKCIL